MKLHKLMVLFFFGLLLSCNSDDDNNNDSVCDYVVVIDQQLYEEASPSAYTITNAEINDDCLVITIGASGCDGGSWQTTLVSDLPVEAGGTGGSALSLKLTNLEVCEAYLTRTFSFDLSIISDENINTVFGLEGWEGTLEVFN